MRNSSKAGTSGSQPADWSQLLPELLKPRKPPTPPTMEQFSAALQAVADSYGQGYINEAEADLLLRHLCSAFIANELVGLLRMLSGNPFEKSRNSESHTPIGLLSSLIKG